MTAVSRQDDRFEVDATLIAEGFDLDPASVAGFMRDGQITSRCEAGVDADSGRWRRTFYHRDRALRLTIDGAGQIVSRARFAVADRTAGADPAA